jgi:hypothetical protein
VQEPAAFIEQPAASPPIIEARSIEKGFGRPGGEQIQVIAPTSLSVEPGVIIALLARISHRLRSTSVENEAARVFHRPLFCSRF